MTALSPEDEAQLTSDAGGLDPGIREIVRILREANVETFESCEGSPGHAFFEPTVRFHGNQTEGFRALAWARTRGLRVAELRRYWSIEDGEPVGPKWEMTFVGEPWLERIAHDLVARRAELTAEIARIDARLRELDGRATAGNPLRVESEKA